MTIDGRFARGVVRGYEVSVWVNPLEQINPCRVYVACHAAPEEKREMLADIQAKRIKYLMPLSTQYGISFGYNGITVKAMCNEFPSTLDKVIDAIEAHGGLGATHCPVCGRAMDETAKPRRVEEWATLTLDEACAADINAVIAAENDEFDRAPNNYLRGFLGALLGALVGGGIAFVLYLVGFISAISAIVAVFLGAFLFEKFGGKPTKMMVVIVAVTTLAVMFLSVFAVYLYAASSAAAEAGANVSALEAFKILIQDKEFARTFYLDLGMVAVFSIIGIVAQSLVVLRRIKRKKGI